MNPNDLSPPAGTDLTRSLSRHLNDYAAGVDAAPDHEALLRGMQRIDRNRRIRNVGAGGCMVAVLAFGLLALGGGGDETGSDLDVRGEAPTAPPDDPSLIPGVVEQTGSGARGAGEHGASDSIGTAGGPGDPGAGVNRFSDGDDPAVPDHLQVAPTPSTPPAETTTTTPTTTTSTTTTTTTAPPPTTTTVTAVSFSAFSQYGSCGEDPPYDEYSGTAVPGTVITISSPWSATAQTTADAAGNWYLRVEFPEAPVGEVFTVTASDGSGNVDMSFVRTA